MMKEYHKEWSEKHKVPWQLQSPQLEEVYNIWKQKIAKEEHEHKCKVMQTEEFTKGF